MSEEALDMVMRFVVGIVLGGILGSFITMLVYRLPRGKSLISPPSSCPACRKKIEWRDMIPVVSYQLLKGKCRACGKPYGKRYFMIEVVSVVITTLLLVTYGFTDQGYTTIAIFVAVYTIGVIVANQGKDDGSPRTTRGKASGDEEHEGDEEPSDKK